jgi:hypothetical protein
MVAHNENLVINTDADKIKIAGVGAQQAGDRAFKERARRLRVRLER